VTAAVTAEYSGDTREIGEQFPAMIPDALRRIAGELTPEIAKPTGGVLPLFIRAVERGDLKLRRTSPRRSEPKQWLRPAPNGAQKRTPISAQLSKPAAATAGALSPPFARLWR
jgi:hypothetical protein